MCIKRREAYIKTFLFGVKKKTSIIILLFCRSARRLVSALTQFSYILASTDHDLFKHNEYPLSTLSSSGHSAWGLSFVLFQMWAKPRTSFCKYLKSTIDAHNFKQSYSPNASAYFKNRNFANQRCRLQSCQNRRSGKDEMSFVHEVDSYWTWARPSTLLPPLSMGPKSFWEMV